MGFPGKTKAAGAVLWATSYRMCRHQPARKTPPPMMAVMAVEGRGGVGSSIRPTIAVGSEGGTAEDEEIEEGGMALGGAVERSADPRGFTRRMKATEGLGGYELCFGGRERGGGMILHLHTRRGCLRRTL